MLYPRSIESPYFSVFQLWGLISKRYLLGGYGTNCMLGFDLKCEEFGVGGECGRKPMAQSVNRTSNTDARCGSRPSPEPRRI